MDQSIKNILEILSTNSLMTIRDFENLQRIYDDRFVDPKFKTSLAKVEHTYAHMGKLMGRLAEYVEAKEEGRDISDKDIREKVIPDLLVYAVWLAEEFGVNVEEAYLTRFVGNISRLHSDSFSPQELSELERRLKKSLK